MDRSRLTEILEAVQAGRLGVVEALELLAGLPFEAAAGGLTLDTHRELRTGFPEAVYAAGKTPEQVAEAAARLAAAHDRLLVTRADPAQAEAVRAVLPAAVHHAGARCLSWRRDPPPPPCGRVAVVCAGTSDLPVAEEARLALELQDVAVDAFPDVGVAGLHRLLAALPALRRAEAVVAVAGLEGALPGVLAGLVAAPVVAVPTSVGYGAALGGLAALLAMLNSCAPGVAVVNIDNGFGAALVAGRMVRRRART